jgi:hypothetical protein
MTFKGNSCDEPAMPSKINPLKLNALQLKTLTLFQAIARIEGAGVPGPGMGEITIQHFPNPHGDHFHLGNAVVAARDATGMHNEAVWNALHRKGLARSEWPHAIVLTPDGVAYDTGLAGQMLRTGGH